MSREVLATRVGMIEFATPRRAQPYDVMAETAIRRALTDAGVGLDQIQQAFGGIVCGDSMSAQHALYRPLVTSDADIDCRHPPLHGRWS